MLTIAPEIFERFPGVVIGTVVAREIDNTGAHPQLGERLRAAEAAVRAELAGTVLVEHPRILPWREAYRAFGAKPKKYPSSIEALVRRVIKGDELPSINPLVDLYNVVSLSHLLPGGGEDIGKLEGPLELRFAGPDEPEVELLGRPQPAAPLEGEVIYTDSIGAVCRRWNWREAARTCLGPETREAILVIEALPPMGAQEVAAALDELCSLAEHHCRAGCTSSIYQGRDT